MSKSDVKTYDMIIEAYDPYNLNFPAIAEF